MLLRKNNVQGVVIISGICVQGGKFRIRNENKQSHQIGGVLRNKY